MIHVNHMMEEKMEMVQTIVIETSWLLSVNINQMIGITTGIKHFTVYFLEVLSHKCQKMNINKAPPSLAGLFRCPVLFCHQFKTQLVSHTHEIPAALKALLERLCLCLNEHLCHTVTAIIITLTLCCTGLSAIIVRISEMNQNTIIVKLQDYSTKGHVWNDLILHRCLSTLMCDCLLAD